VPSLQSLKSQRTEGTRAAPERTSQQSSDNTLWERPARVAYRRLRQCGHEGKERGWRSAAVAKPVGPCESNRRIFRWQNV